MISAPAFWYESPASWRARCLAPFSAAWRIGGAVRRALVKAQPLPGPCLCTGNAVVGGGGKTPAVQMIARLLHQAGRKPAVVLKGYGGTLGGPVLVDPARHDAAAVGDEALLHAEFVPTVVARDRVRGAEVAFAQGADIVLFDDGMQNPALVRARKLLVIDGTMGIGNGRVVPAGPLREPFAKAAASADAVLILDDDRHDLALRAELAGRPVVRARRSILIPPDLYFKPVVAFSGIAHPRAFFASLARKGIQLAHVAAFADHHAFTQGELDALWDVAAARGARLVTTAKDWARLPNARRAACTVVPLDLEMTERDRDALLAWALASPDGHPDSARSG